MISDFLRDNPILTLLFCAHFLADFQWQSQSLADSNHIVGGDSGDIS